MGLDQNVVREFRQTPHFRGIDAFARAVWPAITRFLDKLGADVNAVEREILAAPEVPGYEKLLVELVGYSPLSARMITWQLRHWGELLADEINEGRQLRAMIDQIAKTSGRSLLIISRRANKKKKCASLEAQDLIDRAIQKAGLLLTTTEFYQLVELAGEREESACRDLGRIAEELAPHLPEKRGRPISAWTCTHLFMRRHLESWGLGRAYTYSEAADPSDFVDQVTQASRLAAQNRRFSPLHANFLYKMNTLPPPELFPVSWTSKLPGAAERTQRRKGASLRS